MIRTIHGVGVMLDRDLAKIYGVPTKAFNQAVKRNRLRFPEDFMFRLTQKEAKALQVSRSQIVTLKRGQNIKYLPYAFTEYGGVDGCQPVCVRSPTKFGLILARVVSRNCRDRQSAPAFLEKLRKITAGGPRSGAEEVRAMETKSFSSLISV